MNRIEKALNDIFQLRNVKNSKSLIVEFIEIDKIAGVKFMFCVLFEIIVIFLN